ncbi:MAG: hypothetical protein ACR2QF_01305 [Geminicoccaceae bacterium]
MTPGILNRTLGNPEQPYRNSYDGTWDEDVEAAVKDGDMVLHKGQYRITMQAVMKYGIAAPEIEHMCEEGEDPCPGCDGKGAHHEIIEVGEHSYPTFELLDCVECQGTGEVDL